MASVTLMVDAIGPAGREAIARLFGGEVLVKALQNAQALELVREGRRQALLRELGGTVTMQEESPQAERRRRELAGIAKVMRQRSAAGERRRNGNG